MSATLDPRVQRICWYVARRCRELEVADAYQEGMLAILEAEHAGKPLGGYRWMHVFLRRRVGDKAVALRRWRRWQSPEARPTPADVGMTAGDRLDVPGLLDLLEPRQREAVRLRIWEGLSPEEADAAMGVAPKTSAGYLWKGLRRLRDAYA
jgi:DNA-directed RNA polymerase specialized sigma24 family protein